MLQLLGSLVLPKDHDPSLVSSFKTASATAMGIFSKLFDELEQDGKESLEKFLPVVPQWLQSIACLFRDDEWQKVAQCCNFMEGVYQAAKNKNNSPEALQPLKQSLVQLKSCWEDCKSCVENEVEQVTYKQHIEEFIKRMQTQLTSAGCKFKAETVATVETKMAALQAVIGDVPAQWTETASLTTLTAVQAGAKGNVLKLDPQKTEKHSAELSEEQLLLELSQCHGLVRFENSEAKLGPSKHEFEKYKLIVQTLEEPGGNDFEKSVLKVLDETFVALAVGRIVHTLTSEKNVSKCRSALQTLMKQFRSRLGKEAEKPTLGTALHTKVQAVLYGRAA
eukprot:6477895-Amphidinium_carterae.1